MEFHLLLLSIFTVLSLTHVASHAALSPQAYWYSVLPNSPMPQAVKNLLPQEASLRRSDKAVVGHIDFAEANLHGGDKDARAIIYNVGKGDKDARAIIYNVGKGDKDARAIIYNVGREDKDARAIIYNAGKGDKDARAIIYNVGREDKDARAIIYNAGKGDKDARAIIYNVGKEDKDARAIIYFAEANVRREDKDARAIIYNVGGGDKDARAIIYNMGKGDKDARAIIYNVGRGDEDAKAVIYFAEANINRQLHYNPNETIYFLEEDIKQGTEMNLDLSKEANGVKFLPRTVAQSMPFSSNEFPKILNQFSVKPNSAEAKIMKKTIEVCTEMPAFKGEQKYCATSLESMIDFCTSILGKRVKALSTELEKETQLRKFNVVGFKKIGGGEVAVCHMLKYPYAVFSCHNVHSTKVYMVSLEDAEEGGTKAKGVAVCHTDTAAWSPNFEAFQMLNVKPGTVPICHILPEDNIVWLRN
ncbi:BURP domain protein RD22 [Camellia lanceoleosa]|uniref:BURP domain protein RD22 n=1 Tax=Camellia lanceoleosa TaxID=1840588 RepID=A0ACC0GNJ7_9ERIC|nr:BURP domain protein RD22 [Camellia lanceoleosa]